MTRAKIIRQVCRRTCSATLLTFSLLTISLLTISALPISPVLAAGAAPAAGAVTVDLASTPGAADDQTVMVSVATVKPGVALPKSAVKVTGSVRNSGKVSITLPVARALIGQRPLSTRQDVSNWATTESELPLDEVARVLVGKTLLPGAVAAFTLTIPANAIGQALRNQPFAVLPVRVEVAGTTSGGTQQSGDVHTFLPALARVKRFEPMSIAWLFPLALDPDPALQGSPSTARTAAWQKAIGPGSRLDRLIQGTKNANVTWAIDPAILGPQETPLAVEATASSGPTPSPSASQPSGEGTPPPPDPVTVATTALTARLKAAAAGHILWSLPYADPDLAALLPTASGNQILNKVISHPSTLDATVGPARADIAWPVDGTLTPPAQTLLRQAFASPGLAAAVTSSTTLESQNRDTTDATHKSSSGLPLLAYDDLLSKTVAQTSSKATGAVTIQRFLADSLALLGEREGTRNRSVLVAEPRTFAGDPTVLRSLFAAVEQEAPWLSRATTGQLLSASMSRTPDSPLRDAGLTTTAPTAPAATSTVSDPTSPGTSPLTSDQLATVPGTLSDIRGIASILGNGQVFADTWADAQVQKLSTRWRDHPEGPAAIDALTKAAIDEVSRNVRVAPSRVNFFADKGVMQVTVLNDLPVAIHDVRLTLTPAQPRLRIERQPLPLRIGAKARANVLLPVTSIAAGQVNIDAVLTTPNGTRLGQDATVNVQVQPPASWIYWVLGGLAGIVLILGTQRSLRRGSTRAARDEEEPPL